MEVRERIKEKVNFMVINPRRACAARVTVVVPCVYSRTSE